MSMSTSADEGIYKFGIGALCMYYRGHEKERDNYLPHIQSIKK